MTQAVPSLPWLVKELRPIPAGGTFFFEGRDCQKEDKHNPKPCLASTAHNLYLIWSKIFGEEKWWLRRERKMWVSLLQAGSVLVCKHSIWWQNTVVTLWCRVKIAGTPLYRGFTFGRLSIPLEHAAVRWSKWWSAPPENISLFNIPPPPSVNYV